MFLIKRFNPDKSGDADNTGGISAAYGVRHIFVLGEGYQPITNMLLRIRSLLPYAFGKANSKWRVLLFLLLGTCGYAAGQPKPVCFAQMPVYDAKGNHLDFHIVAVNMDQENAADLLHNRDQEHKVVAEGEIMYFPKSLLRSRLRITLQNPKGSSLKEQVMLVDCQQRNSLRYGQEFDGFDVAWSTISGHLSGCQFTGDWWVRAMPMFGGPGAAWAYDGHIRSDGKFSISGNMPGVRHMIVVGKDKQPIRVIAVDVTVGIAENEAGSVDLTGLCPK